jgi:hypothetical protein
MLYPAYIYPGDAKHAHGVQFFRISRVVTRPLTIGSIFRLPRKRRSKRTLPMASRFRRPLRLRVGCTIAITEMAPGCF